MNLSTKEKYYNEYSILQYIQAQIIINNIIKSKFSDISKEKQKKIFSFLEDKIKSEFNITSRIAKYIITEYFEE